MIKKNTILFLTLLVQISTHMAAQQVQQHNKPGITINPAALPGILNTFGIPSPMQPGSAGNAAGKASIGEAGAAVGIGLQSIAQAMVHPPQGVTFPAALKVVGEALQAMTAGDPKDGGMRHFAGSLNNIAHAIQNIGIKNGSLESLDAHALKLIALCGGGCSACSIPLYGASCSNCCCLAVSLAALRPRQSCELAIECLPCQLPKDIGKLLLRQATLDHVASKPQALQTQRDDETPRIPVIVSPATQPLAQTTTYSKTDNARSPLNSSYTADHKKEPKKDK